MMSIVAGPVNWEDFWEIFNFKTKGRRMQDSLSPVDPDREPFLNFDSASELSPEDELAVYCSLVALVKADYPFDNVLQNRTVHFLRSLEPKPNTSHPPPRQMTNLVLSSVGSASAFFDGILTLLASPHSTVAAAALSCLSFIENDDDIWSILVKIKLSLKEWRKQGQEVVQSGKQILQALFLEGFEVTLEQKLLNDIDGDYGHNVVDDCLALIQSLGSNMPR
ncbi:hypothetical protein BLNAU_14888 [Blattamonas nauphoetae]|uniref:Uncharacterized protein n=1 Tax=Blattamonas nauphoetae TaxID=2049346 RepID=A0ABQ9XHU2_9EUKA|nr:hypothetical protein BLNAU_14888 [Blattamonas nauphoetae]